MSSLQNVSCAQSRAAHCVATRTHACHMCSQTRSARVSQHLSLRNTTANDSTLKIHFPVSFGKLASNVLPFDIAAAPTPALLAAPFNWSNATRVIQHPSFQHFDKQHTIRSTACLANPRRVAKVTKLIEREIGSLMQTDSLLMDITKPQSTAGDVKGTLCSCTGVHVTSDLQVVKVYVSVYSDDDEAKKHTVKRLSGLSGYVRRLIGERVQLRLTPEIRFVHDTAVERGERVLSLLQKMKNEEQNPGPNLEAQEGDTAATLADPVAKKANPFLEGVGETDYDSDQEDEDVTFFSADMFPDSSFAEEELAAARKRDAFKMRKGSPRFRKSRKKKMVRR